MCNEKENIVQQLTNTQRQFLRKEAHDLHPTVQIGKNGLTEQVIASTEQQFNTQELLKVKFMDFRDQKEELAEQLSDEVRAILVAMIGNIAILYREHRDPEKRLIRLPRS